MPDQARVLALLDELQAAEQRGAAALGRWIACCNDPVLRAGLRVVRARDLAHATLASTRLEELGGQPHSIVSPRLDELCALLGAPGASDRVKLGILLARFPEGTRDPFEAVLGTLETDDETRTLLDGVRDDDRLGLDWLHGIAHAPPVMPRERVGEREQAGVAAFLAALRAALVGAAEVGAAWAGVSPSDGLRGGLRTIAARHSAHAALASERLRELGGQPEATMLAPAVLGDAHAWYGAPERSDDTKLARLLDPAGPCRAPLEAVERVAASLLEDVETREMLRLIAASEQATLAWLAAYRAAAAAPAVA